MKKERWEPIEIVEVGRVAEILRGGGGKLSTPTDDTGDIFKPPGQE